MAKSKEDAIKVVVDEGCFKPTRAHEDDAGYDLRTPIPFMLSDVRNQITIDTGVHIELPKGYFARIAPKSGLNVNYGILTDGIIDCGYTGSIVVKLYMFGDKMPIFEKGDKIAQLIIQPYIAPKLDVVDIGELAETERGDNGFGSTGR